MESKISVKLIIILLILGFQFSCEDELQIQRWDNRSFGRFEKHSFDELDLEDKERVLLILNNLKVLRPLTLSATQDYSSMYNVQSLFSLSRELFYISDIQGDYNKVSAGVVCPPINRTLLQLCLRM